MELVKKAREARPTQFVSTHQARAFLGPIGFAHFAQTFEGQALQKLENEGHENRFHGR
jgi:hypothetical protein